MKKKRSWGDENQGWRKRRARLLQREEKQGIELEKEKSKVHEEQRTPGFRVRVRKEHG